MGKIVARFGDKGSNGEITYCIALEVRPSAIVTSPINGQVVLAGKFRNYGNMLIISNGEYRVFLYCIDSISVTTGEVLEIGDYIGKMSEKSAGSSAIVKMELRKSGEPLDPMQWLRPPSVQQQVVQTQSVH
jgi:septal ring factor EnvC (AmiA/AmiB activator)